MPAGFTSESADNIDYGEMIHAYDGSEEGITTVSVW